MSTSWQIGIGAFSGILLLTPLIPALNAWRLAATDSTQPDNDIATQDWLMPVDRFRSSVQLEFATLLQMARDGAPNESTAHGAIRGAGADGVPFIILGPKDHLAEHMPPSARRLRQMVLSTRHLDIPGEIVCEQHLYADGRVNIAHDALVRMVFGGREVVIGMRARVLQWVHAELRLDAAEGATLYGCASAGREMSLARRTRFQRLYAPRILFGRPQIPPPTVPIQRVPFDPPAHVKIVDGRWMVAGDLHIPPSHEVTADLVVTGHLMLDRGCRVNGKAHVGRTVVLVEGARMNGAVFAKGSVHIGKRCHVLGPLVTLRTLRTDAFSELGQLDHPTTISARKIRAAESCIAHGAIWARQIGEVMSDPGTTT